MPTLLMGETVRNVAAGIDNVSYRFPLGVVAAITPFNFPFMVPLWTLPIAIGAGNCYILKPSEKTPLSALRIIDLLQESGVPKGVVSLVNGGKEVVDALLDHPGIAAVSFVGSQPVAQHVYHRGTAKNKRVQALSGAKNAMIVMPDADIEPTVETITSLFTRSGSAARTFRERIGAGMLGINVGVAAPMAYFPFNGIKDSFYGDLHATGKDGVRFFAESRVEITRWFS
jgi:malonate-semialdehyde dehydrogenase (acetylating) / methylmalonate-semialdehyde dehydrogenase